MISIEISGEFLDISNNSDFEIVKNNRRFQKKASGAFSEIPFSIPDTIKNRKILSFFSHTDNISYTKEFAATLYDDGNKKHTGLLLIRDYDGQFNAVFYGENANFFQATSKILLTDIPYYEKFSEGKADNFSGDGIRELIDDEFLRDISNYIYRYPSKNFVFFPYFNDNFKEDLSSYSDLEYVNFWDKVNMKFTQTKHDDLVSQSEYYSFIGFFFLEFVFKKAVEHAGYNLGDTVFDYNNELRNIVIWNYNYRHILNSVNRSDHSDLEEGSCYMSFERDLPPLSIHELIKEIEKRLNIYIDVDEDLKVVNLRKNIIKAEHPQRVKPLKTIKHIGKKIKGVNFETEVAAAESETLEKDEYKSGSPDYFTINSKATPVPSSETQDPNLPYMPISLKERSTQKIGINPNEGELKLSIFRGMNPTDETLRNNYNEYIHFGSVNTFSSVPSHNNGNPLASNPDYYLYGQFLTPRHRITRTGDLTLQIETFEDNYYVIDSVHYEFILGNSDTYYDSTTSWKGSYTYLSKDIYTLKVKITTSGPETKIFENTYDIDIRNSSYDLEIGEYIEYGSDPNEPGGHSMVFVEDEKKTYRWEKISDVPEFYWQEYNDNSDWYFKQNAYPYANSKPEYYLGNLKKYNNYHEVSLMFDSSDESVINRYYSDLINWVLSYMEDFETSFLLDDVDINNEFIEIEGVWFIIEKMRIDYSRKKIEANIKRL